MRHHARRGRHCVGRCESLSAEGRVSAYVLLGLPIFLGLFMFFFRSATSDRMYTESVGIVAPCSTVVMMTLGAWSG